MNSITLNWKEFSVNLEKVKLFFKNHLSNNFDGLLCNTEDIKVLFFDNFTEEDENIVNDYWNNLTESSFDLTTEEYIKTIVIPQAKIFVSQLENDFVVENIALGISSSGKTGDVLGLLSKRVVLDEGQEGVSLLDSLYGVCPSLTVTVRVLDWHLNNIEQYSSLSPFITEERFINVKHRIQTFLGVSLT